MEITAYAVGILGEWIVLMLILPVAQKLADFALPGLLETAWKLLLIIVVSTAVSAGLGRRSRRRVRPSPSPWRPGSR